MPTTYACAPVRAETKKWANSAKSVSGGDLADLARAIGVVGRWAAATDLALLLVCSYIRQFVQDTRALKALGMVTRHLQASFQMCFVGMARCWQGLV